MITEQRTSAHPGFPDYYGLSTDTKPTGDKVFNSAVFYEMDTQKVYMYNAASSTWIQQ